MGVGRIFFPGGANSGFFQRQPKIFFQGEAKSGEIPFFSLETKKTIFFAKNKIGKCQILKCRGDKALVSFRTAYITSTRFAVVERTVFQNFGIPPLSITASNVLMIVFFNHVATEVLTTTGKWPSSTEQSTQVYLKFLASWKKVCWRVRCFGVGPPTSQNLPLISLLTTSAAPGWANGYGCFLTCAHRTNAPASPTHRSSCHILTLAIPPNGIFGRLKFVPLAEKWIQQLKRLCNPLHRCARWTKWNYKVAVFILELVSYNIQQRQSHKIPEWMLYWYCHDYFLFGKSCILFNSFSQTGLPKRNEILISLEYFLCMGMLYQLICSLWSKKKMLAYYAFLFKLTWRKHVYVVEMRDPEAIWCNCIPILTGFWPFLARSMSQAG